MNYSLDELSRMAPTAHWECEGETCIFGMYKKGNANPTNNKNNCINYYSCPLIDISRYLEKLRIIRNMCVNDDWEEDID